MNNIVIPYWYELILAFSKDFENEDISWKDLYDRLFIPKTDINNLMSSVLKDIGVNMKDKVSIEAVSNLKKNVTCTYEIIEKDNLFILRIPNTQEKTFLEKNDKTSIDKALARLGYYLETK